MIGGLLETVRAELGPVEQAIRSHRYLAELEAGRVPVESLRAFAGEQQAIVASDRRSFEELAARFPEPPAGPFFLDLAHGEGVALEHLTAFVAPDEGYEPKPCCQAYPAYVAWLALNGSRADVALAFLANLAAWGENCGRIAEALRDRYDVSFFDFFATPPPDFEERALAVIEAGLAAGDAPERARRAARFLQAYELLYWDTLADALQ